MIKEKLISIRKSKKISQSDIAFQLNITQSQYCRREKGETKITLQEWTKIASVLNVTLSSIYESEEYNSGLLGSAMGNGDKSDLYDTLIAKLPDYFRQLELENIVLKNKIAALQNKCRCNA